VDSAGGKTYGTVTDVAATGANDIYCVEDENKKETWIPAIPQVIEKVDIEGETLYITPMEGLFDDED
jgi:16S rRNA processing protein RimM